MHDKFAKHRKNTRRSQRQARTYIALRFVVFWAILASVIFLVTELVKALAQSGFFHHLGWIF